MTDAYLKEDLVALRKGLGLTQQAMAEDMGLSLPAYQAINDRPS